MTSSPTPFPLGAYTGDPNGSSASADATFAANYGSFVATMGVAPQFLDTYVDYTQPVSSWISNASWQAWSDAITPDAQYLTPVIGLPMYSTAAGALTPDQQYQAIIAGQDDSVLAGIVQAYVSEGFSTLVFRPGWEMNLQGPTFAGSTAQDQADWVAAFQHIYTALHADAAADGASVTVVWNPGATNYSSVSATIALYPGNNHVDAIGADVYSDIYPFNDGDTPATYHDWATGAEDTTVAQFIANPVNRAHYWTYPAATEWSLDSSQGHSLSLDSIIQFAEQQGKPLAIPETGAGNSNSGTDVQDDPAFPQWLSQQLITAQASGGKIDFVNIWDSNGGGNYEFSYAADGKPLEAAAWAKYFGGQPLTAITVTAVAPVATTDSIAAEPWAGLTITDPNTAQIETAVVTLSNIGNGVLSDLNAAADGSTVSNGRYTVSGTAATVAKALDGLMFTPTAHQVAAGQTVATTITLAISDTAGETTSAITTVTATAVPTILGAGTSTLTLFMSEQAAPAGAQFTISVDGKQIGGVQTTMANSRAGKQQQYNILGSFADGAHTVAIDYLNASNSLLIVNSATINNASVPSSTVVLSNTGTAGFSFIATGSITPVSVGSGPDTVALFMAERAAPAGAQFLINVNGAQIGGVQTTTANSALGQTQEFDINGTFSPGADTLSVNYLNAANSLLYIDNATINGAAVPESAVVLSNVGAAGFSFDGPTINAAVTVGTGGDTLALTVSEQAQPAGAQFTVDVNGSQIGGVLTTAASSVAGQTQVIDVLGNFLSGANTVTLNYLNASNSLLNLVGATIDAAAVVNSALTLSNIGSAGFTFYDVAARTNATVIGSGPDDLTLQTSQRGQPMGAQFTVAVDGTQVGGVQTTTANATSGQVQELDVLGTFAPGSHTVSVDYLNASNSVLTVASATINGSLIGGASQSISNIGSSAFNFITPSTPAPAIIGSGPDTLALSLSEDYLQANGTFNVFVDGEQIGLTQTATAIRGNGQSQVLDVLGSFSGIHTVAVDFLNAAASGGSAGSLYLGAAAIDGTAIANSALTLSADGSKTFSFTH